ncbi:MAG TPA: MgtC/SapB family protein [Opitutaceae bacterium]|jgi:putative Mg2+ transporter-C (MgtC) family protein
MPLLLTWQDAALRLGLAFLASWILGLNRERHGETAGTRTTILVCLAAAISMVQVNLLMITQDRPASAFSVLDLMRLPLGILTGMGFIGAGAIVKRNNIAQGVTTAATLWFATVMGLAFGGGQLWLGTASFALGIVVIVGLKGVELRSMVHDRGDLVLSVVEGTLGQAEIESVIAADGGQPMSCATSFRSSDRIRTFAFTVSWRTRPDSSVIPPFVEKLQRSHHLVDLAWRPDRSCGLPGDRGNGSPGS